MIRVGYKLSAEEFGAPDLVEQAIRAEAAGFAFALLSDHFHPWSSRQGQSPFVWSVLGAIAQATKTLRIGTAVTCPTMRVHPAVVAQAAATTATMMPGRFFLGLGTGENLNEHVIGKGWPPGDLRLAMLEEALEVIRLLWKGDVQSHRGTYYRVDDAQLFSLPDEPPHVMLAASKPKAAELAGRAAEAMITTTIDRRLVERFVRAGGEDKPRFVELSACWAADEARARRTAHEIWPLAALPDPLFTELAQPSHFEAAFSSLTEEQVAENVLCGPDPQQHVAKIREAEAAGYTDVCVHQIGPEQQEFVRFYEREVLPHLHDEARPASRSPRTLRAPRATRPEGRPARKVVAGRRK